MGGGGGEDCKIRGVNPGRVGMSAVALEQEAEARVSQAPQFLHWGGGGGGHKGGRKKTAEMAEALAGLHTQTCPYIVEFNKEVAGLHSKTCPY